MRNIPLEKINRSRNLRRNSTPAEHFLWNILRGRRFENFRFRRQKPIGPYIVDFYCPNKKLVIELDGGQHNDANARIYDATRSEFLTKKHISVLRFWNNQLFNETYAVLECIWRELHNQSTLTLNPSPGQRERENTGTTYALLATY